MGDMYALWDAIKGMGPRGVAGRIGGGVMSAGRKYGKSAAIGGGVGLAGVGGYKGYRHFRSSGRNGLQGRSSGGMTGMY